jgi:hypothetical protein
VPGRENLALRAANLKPFVVTSLAMQTGVITLNPPVWSNLVFIIGVTTTRGTLAKLGIFTGKSPSNEINVTSQSPFWPAGEKSPLEFAYRDSAM